MVATLVLMSLNSFQIASLESAVSAPLQRIGANKVLALNYTNVYLGYLLVQT